MSAEALEWLRLGFTVMAFLLAGGSNVYVYFRTRYAARRDEVDEVLTGLQTRVERIEADQRHAPTQQQLEQVHRDITALNGEIRELGGSMKGLKAGMDIIHQHLLNQSTKGRGDG